MAPTVAAAASINADDRHPSPSSSSSSTSTTTAEESSSFRELDDVFLQTQTGIWLGQVLHTRLDDHLNISDLLADGELLLEVSKVLWTMLLAKCKELENVKGHNYNPVGSRKSSGRYRPYSNVDSFLKMCKILGLSGIDLFSPSDVVEKRDTRKVCICIRSLSKRARSKQLKVPDFDIVTYTASMPKKMVGYLRKSLEPTTGSFSSSIYDSQLEDSKLKLRKKKLASTSERNYDSYSDASDEAESNYMGGPPYYLPMNHSCDTTWKDSEFENLQGTSLTASQEDVHDEDKNKLRLGGGKSAYVGKQTRSICLQDVNCTSPSSVKSRQIFTSTSPFHNGRREHIQEMGDLELTDAESAIADDAFLGDSLDEKTLERLYVNSRSTFPDLLDFGADEECPFQLEGEDNSFNLLMGSDWPGSNSTGRISVNDFGRRSFDDFEDVEVSSVTSMSSILGRALDLDFDDQIDVEGSEDSGTAEATVTDLYEMEASSDSGYTTTPFASPCPNGLQSQTKGYGSAPYHRGSSGELKSSVVSAEIGNEWSGAAAMIEQSPAGSSNHDHLDDSVDSSNGGVEGNELQHHKDENSLEVVEPLVESSSESGENVNARPSGTQPHRSRPLLRTVIKGTAVFGIIFFLNQLSGRSSGEVSKIAVIQKASGCGESKSTREENKGKRSLHGIIYSTELLRF